MHLTENEVLSKYVECLSEGRELCMLLARNADPEKVGPRGGIYSKLRTALRELEGCCRQMNYMREDARWVKMGIMWAKAMRIALDAYTAHNWLKFGKLAELFDNGLKRMRDLADARTGVRGAILPQRPSDWLILPDRPLPGITRGLIH